jgi:hypothetical protein
MEATSGKPPYLNLACLPQPNDTPKLSYQDLANFLCLFEGAREPAEVLARTWCQRASYGMFLEKLYEAALIKSEAVFFGLFNMRQECETKEQHENKFFETTKGIRDFSQMGEHIAVESLKWAVECKDEKTIQLILTSYVKKDEKSTQLAFKLYDLIVACPETLKKLLQAKENYFICRDYFFGESQKIYSIFHNLVSSHQTNLLILFLKYIHRHHKSEYNFSWKFCMELASKNKLQEFGNQIFNETPRPSQHFIDTCPFAKEIQERSQAS